MWSKQGVDENIAFLKSMNKKELIKLIINKPYFVLSLIREAYPSKFFIHGNKPYNPCPRYGYGKNPHQKLYNIINKSRNIYKNNLKLFYKYKNYFL